MSPTPKKKKTQPVNEVEVMEVHVEDVVDQEKPSQKNSIDILDEAGNLVRTYSIELHGENFAALADSYIEGHPNCQKA